jgi:hypothetical protein
MGKSYEIGSKRSTFGHGMTKISPYKQVNLYEILKSSTNWGANRGLAHQFENRNCLKSEVITNKPIKFLFYTKTAFMHGMRWQLLVCS